jgi:chaperonin cofactor prefoldin
VGSGGTRGSKGVEQLEKEVSTLTEALQVAERQHEELADELEKVQP